MTSRYSRWIGPGLLLVLTVGMLGDVLFAGGNRVLGFASSDLPLQFLPWRDYGFRELARGNIALWNPHIFGGAPYFGMMQAALFYPPNGLFLILPLASAINWSIALHLFLIGVLMFCWMQQRGLGVVPGFFAGALTMFCGAFYLHIFAGHLPHLCAMTWAPLVFCAIDALFETRRVRWYFFATAAVASQLLAGFPQYAYYTAIVAALYSLVRLIQRWNWRGAILLLAIYPAAIVIAAVQLLPAIQATRETIRATPLPFHFAAAISLPPENFLTLLAPNLFGEIAGYLGRGYLWETCLFIGATGITFAIYGMVYGNRQATLPSLVVIAATLLLALGAHTPLFRLLYDWAPGFDRFRGVAKFGFFASLFLIVLAATGLDQLLERKKAERGFIASIAALAVSLGLGAWSIARFSWWHSLMETFPGTGETFLRPEFYASSEFITQSGHSAILSLLSAATVCLLLSGILFLGNRHPRLFIGVALIGVLEMSIFAAKSKWTFDSTRVVDRGEQRFLEEHPGDYRIINPVNPNSAMSAGAQDLWGYDASVVRRYAEFITWTQGLPPDQALQNINFARLDPLYGMLRLAYVFAQNGAELQVADAPFAPLRHLQFISNYRVFKARDAIFEAMRAPGFNPEQEVILETEPQPPPSPGKGAGTAEIVDVSTDGLTIEAKVAQPTIMLITDTFTPSWHAIALPGSDQKSYQLVPANYVLRAVPLAAGHHQLRIEYQSIGFEFGKWISAVACVLYLGALRLFWKSELRT